MKMSGRRKDLRPREKREFFEIDHVDAVDLLKNLARPLDDAEIVEYGNISSVEDKSESTIKQQGNRTTFRMLGVPVGSKLTAANKDTPRCSSG
jgi:hypothetical protein